MFKFDTRRVLMVVAAAALVVNFGLAAALGLKRPMTSDSYYFRHLAENLVAGKGYVITDGFWPNTPSMRRLPAWPFLISLGLRLAPGASPDLVMRLIAVAVNSAVAVLLCLLTLRLFGSRTAAGLAGLGYVIHPTALFAMYQGLSEPLFLLLAAGGVLLLLRSGRGAVAGGALALGLAALVRANFVLWLPVAGGLAFAFLWLRDGRPTRARLLTMAAGALLFVLPPVGWAARNHAICGHFPVFSTLRGQTFYGGNNPVVADTLEEWGYWVFPNSIPGETPMAELAGSMSEYDVDVYYYNRGRAFVREHLLAMPRLWLGKCVRAYIPIPWKPSLGSYGISAFRWALYLASVGGLIVAWRATPFVYRVALPAMVLVSLATVVGFWGCARFAFAVEPFLLPYAALAATSTITWCVQLKQRCRAWTSSS